jgi:hypothetical protein
MNNTPTNGAYLSHSRDGEKFMNSIYTVMMYEIHDAWLVAVDYVEQ